MKATKEDLRDLERSLVSRIGSLQTQLDLIKIERDAEHEVHGHPFRHFLRLDNDDPERGLALSPEIALAMRRFVAEEVGKKGDESDESDDAPVVQCIQCGCERPTDAEVMSCEDCVEEVRNDGYREGVQRLIDDMRKRAEMSSGPMRTILITESNRMEAEFLPVRDENERSEEADG